MRQDDYDYELQHTIARSSRLVVVDLPAKSKDTLLGFGGLLLRSLDRVLSDAAAE